GAIDRLKRSLEHVIEKKDNVRPGALELADTDTADIED
ncbi:HPF/RaiA family ribosome-associated protein, partial [Salmonella enterica subsp. enterica]|nr:HPF/RaiA family ribosome-associated protein [Salmonella enterica subsp. enterica]